ncbi:type II secretion system protein [Paucibacter sp. KBW04]|uniref:type II secretion system protein n=1 Tax=Paucibacter sp. KBW04 TaxID=2153361 RepID=UPI00272D4750|nr:type II secretion system protein [Paucibacter sp. KBW04]
MRPPLPARASRGFTLIELVIVMTMIGALAVFALPRLVDTEMWRLRAFSDDLQSQMQAMLRLSLVQRRPIIATISPTGATFAYVGGGPALASVDCPASSSPCIAESGSRSITFNSGNSGSSISSTGAALAVTVSSGSYSQGYVLENETGLFYATP